jgi:hypothetical protein
MRLNKMQDRASRHISRAKHNHGRRHLRRYYYPATETEEEYSDGYEFSAGLPFNHSGATTGVENG